MLFLSQVLGGRAAEKETWSESPAVGGHFQVSLMEAVCAGSIASHCCECVCVCVFTCLNSSSNATPLNAYCALNGK